MRRRWLESEALAFQIQTLPGDPERLSDRVDLAVMLTECGLDHLALASGTTGREILARLGRRFHRVYYAT